MYLTDNSVVQFWSLKPNICSKGEKFQCQFFLNQGLPNGIDFYAKSSEEVVSA